ncbi:MAG: thioredoxin domain-containing protein [Myxococcaceae bacterium]|nr:thioredoxin domain-containing protein [Myxococcaceae bacterium]
MAHPPSAGGTPNRLAYEPSPYLRQHAHNPVDWYPWGEEALARARAEDRPILLSVGYSACHWCHVMAHESFENPDIARVMNAHFINVKVDREERPDLDQLYQGVVQLMGRGGGWPLTVFLTPDLRPFFGGTYFPPDDRHGMPAFPRLLEALADTYRNRRQEVEAQAGDFLDGLKHLSAYGLSGAGGAMTGADVVNAGTAMLRGVDRVHGGFGSAPKFPNPMNLALMLRAWRRSGEQALLDAVLLTLERMARGGIYDQLGGGFHRYSVDARWLVPHFEKMLYDNAQLLHLYAEAFQVAPRPLWREVCEETVAYLQREMHDARGGFYATQDADTEGEEGKFFVWTPAEVDAVLPPELAELAKAHFGITPLGNFEHGRTVLEVVKDAATLAKERGVDVAQVEATLAQAQRLLFAAREKRVRPGRDEKILAGWNGLMIRGLAFAGRVFERADWLALAAGAADFVLKEMWREGRLFRSHQEGKSRIDGLLEDYGDLAAGLTALYQATFDAKYLEAAVALETKARELFWDEERKAYLSAPRGQADLVTPTYALFDNAWPSGASTLTEAQVELAALTGDAHYLTHSEAYLMRMRDELVQNPMGYGHLGLAADAWLEGAMEVVIVGEGVTAAEMLGLLNSTYAPHVTVSLKRPGQPTPRVLAETHRDREPVDGKPAAYVCRQFTCERPVTDAEALREKVAPPVVHAH